jgi:hypothetical protein
MPDLDRALGEVRRFASRPPAPPAPIDSVIRRAQERARQRRRAATAGVALAVLGAVAVAVDHDARSERRVQEGSEGATAPAVRPAGLTVEPATGLAPGDQVSVALPAEPAPGATITQCASEALRGLDGWCDANASWQRVTGGPPDYRVAVVRVIETDHGLIDCADRPQRCVIAVRSEGHGHGAPISFRSDLGQLAEPELSVDRPVIGDGVQVRIAGSGFAPGAAVRVAQCRRQPGQDPADDFAGCDRARAVVVEADGGGRFERQVLLFREVFEPQTGWAACDPCVLRADAIRQLPATTVLQFGGGGASLRPTVQIVPEGPYRRGQLVRLRGAGFQAAAGEVTIGWCRFDTDEPATEEQGVGAGRAACSYPAAGFSVRPDESGTFVVGGFPMPSAAFGFDVATCADPAVLCGLAWHPAEGSRPVFITFFEMVPEP